MSRRIVLVMFLALLMSFGVLFISFAETESESSIENPSKFLDIDGHWAENAIYRWSENGVVNGYNGLFRPDDYVTRGEMAIIMDNMMDYQVASKNAFADLSDGQFYTESILKANLAGIIKGHGQTVRPTDYITKEEAAVMLARAVAVKESMGPNSNFNDADSVSPWAKGSVFGMEAQNYVAGYNGNFNPGNNVTRAELVTIIDNIVKSYYIKAGTYTDNVSGTAIIRVPDVILKDITITGNLIIAEGVGQGSVTLVNVIVKGDIIVRGGIVKTTPILKESAGRVGGGGGGGGGEVPSAIVVSAINRTPTLGIVEITASGTNASALQSSISPLVSVALKEGASNTYKVTIANAKYDTVYALTFNSKFSVASGVSGVVIWHEPLLLLWMDPSGEKYTNDETEINVFFNLYDVDTLNNVDLIMEFKREAGGQYHLINTGEITIGYQGNKVAMDEGGIFKILESETITAGDGAKVQVIFNAPGKYKLDVYAIFNN